MRMRKCIRVLAFECSSKLNTHAIVDGLDKRDATSWGDTKHKRVWVPLKGSLLEECDFGKFTRPIWPHYDDGWIVCERSVFGFFFKCKICLLDRSCDGFEDNSSVYGYDVGWNGEEKITALLCCTSYLPFWVNASSFSLKYGPGTRNSNGFLPAIRLWRKSGWFCIRMIVWIDLSYDTKIWVTVKEHVRRLCKIQILIDWFNQI